LFADKDSKLQLELRVCKLTIIIRIIIIFFITVKTMPLNLTSMTINNSLSYRTAMIWPMDSNNKV